MGYKSILAATYFMLIITYGSASTYINETVGEFQISFEGSDDTFAVVKAWNLTALNESLGTFDPEINGSLWKGDFKIGLATMSLDGNGLSVVLVVLSETPNYILDLDGYFAYVDESYVRIYDRIIDGHKGRYALTGDGPNDPKMGRIGMYWLDDGKYSAAPALVFVLSLESDSVADRIIDTIHVEKIEGS